MALTRTAAPWMVQAAVATAQARHVTIRVAVCDTGGTLCALHRLAGASAVSATGAHGTAAAAAGCGRPSGPVAADAAVFQAPIAPLGGPAPGAVPVAQHGARVGARGGRGATAHQDEACAVLAGPRSRGCTTATGPERPAGGTGDGRREHQGGRVRRCEWCDEALCASGALRAPAGGATLGARSSLSSTAAGRVATPPPRSSATLGWRRCPRRRSALHRHRGRSPPRAWTSGGGRGGRTPSS